MLTHTKTTLKLHTEHQERTLKITSTLSRTRGGAQQQQRSIYNNKNVTVAQSYVMQKITALVLTRSLREIHR